VVLMAHQACGLGATNVQWVRLQSVWCMVHCVLRWCLIFQTYKHNFKGRTPKMYHLAVTFTGHAVQLCVSICGFKLRLQEAQG
jgi:hypothetical protein